MRVRAGDTTIAETSRPRLLSETGLPNRFYIPLADVRRDFLAPNATHTVCPYKGRANYFDLRVAGRHIADAAWYYPTPMDEVARVRDYVCFLADGVNTEVDGVCV